MAFSTWKSYREHKSVVQKQKLSNIVPFCNGHLCNFQCNIEEILKVFEMALQLMLFLSGIMTTLTFASTTQPSIRSRLFLHFKFGKLIFYFLVLLSFSWKNHPPPGFKPRTSHSTVRRFTICAVSPHVNGLTVAC